MAKTKDMSNSKNHHCSMCGETDPSEFSKNCYSRCKYCQKNIYNPMNHFAISRDQVDFLNSCEACTFSGKPFKKIPHKDGRFHFVLEKNNRRPSFDHDHKTLQVRGVVLPEINNALKVIDDHYNGDYTRYIEDIKSYYDPNKNPILQQKIFCQKEPKHQNKYK